MDQIAQRQRFTFTSELHPILETYDPSEAFSISPEHAHPLADRLHVNLSILLFNAQRLRSHCVYFQHLFERFQRAILRPRLPGTARERHLNSKQMALLLEFYLQMDGRWWLLIEPPVVFTGISSSRSLRYENVCFRRSTTPRTRPWSLPWRR